MSYIIGPDLWGKRLRFANSKFTGSAQIQYPWGRRKRTGHRQTLQKRPQFILKGSSEWAVSLEYQLSQGTKAFAPPLQPVCLQGGCITLCKAALFSQRKCKGRIQQWATLPNAGRMSASVVYHDNHYTVFTFLMMLKWLCMKIHTWS